MREDFHFMRNTATPVGKWGFALHKRQTIDLVDLHLIAVNNMRSNDSLQHRRNGIHHFVDDYRFEDVYNHPERSLKRYAQYREVLTPEFSLYADMPLWRQIENTGKNRWVGAYWQSKGLAVIPSICWSTPRSFEFCFDGVERGSVVAVGMIGCRRNKKGFMLGYEEMLKRIEPSAIVVVGKPFPEMQGNLVVVPYQHNGRGGL